MAQVAIVAMFLAFLIYMAAPSTGGPTMVLPSTLSGGASEHQKTSLWQTKTLDSAMTLPERNPLIGR